MHLQLTRRGDYAVRASISLARAEAPDGYVKIREVADEMSIPPRYTQEILTLLMRAGLVEARAGKRGGYRLVKSPEQISLLEVVEAAEGPLRLERCTLSGGPCGTEDTVCAVHAVWEKANRAMTSTLGKESLAQVAANYERWRAHSPMKPHTKREPASTGRPPVEATSHG